MPSYVLDSTISFTKEGELVRSPPQCWLLKIYPTKARISY
ncbi:hypothetical protein HMPREF0742_02720 [Rothia aeria F0184]|uniref:Uncharacterized protein n=1 Tax=Rothia aeria F0184 TaxID=888019 RepID=U7UUL8_9MICC|nr:hypothetical protein HMPREF0742_02720 [Rothia aeria F0184]